MKHTRWQLLVLAVGLAVGGIVLAAPTSTPPAGWPVFRGNTRQTGVATSACPDRLEIRWQFQMTGPVDSTAVIVGSTAYVATEGNGEGAGTPAADGDLYALDLATGKPKWKYRCGPVKAPLAFHHGAVYAGNEDGVFHCVDAATGKKRWTFDVGAEVTSGTNFAGDAILFGANDETLYCLSKEGKKLWTFKVAGGPVMATPAVIGNRTFVAGCDSTLHVLDTSAAGKELASVELGGQTGATCAIVGDRLYVGTMTNQVLAVDWRKAKVVWEHENQRGQPFYSSAAATEDLVVVGCRDKRVYALDRKTGRVVWHFATERKVDASPVVDGQRVYAPSLDGNLYVLRLADGGLVQKLALSKQGIAASPAIAGNSLVVGTREGVVYCLGAKK
jgi:outer membrane protein assembly factor BamB